MEAGATNNKASLPSSLTAQKKRDQESTEITKTVSHLYPLTTKSFEAFGAILSLKEIVRQIKKLVSCELF